MSGMPKASVLPLPVGDCASTSRPASTSGMTSSWTAKADSIPRARSASVSAGSTPRSANELFMKPFVAPLGGAEWVALDSADVDRLRALVALLGVVGDLCSLVQRAVALALDGAVMDEEVLALVIRRDEAVALLIAEPLDCSGCHVSYLHGVGVLR